MEEWTEEEKREEWKVMGFGCTPSGLGLPRPSSKNQEPEGKSETKFERCYDCIKNTAL